MKKILEFLESRECEVNFGWLGKNTFGQLDYEKDVITINILLLLAATYIHECLHYLYSEKSEEEICEMTNKALNRLPVSLIKKIGIKLLENFLGI